MPNLALTAVLFAGLFNLALSQASNWTYIEGTINNAEYTTTPIESESVAKEACDADAACKGIWQGYAKSAENWCLLNKAGKRTWNAASGQNVSKRQPNVDVLSVKVKTQAAGTCVSGQTQGGATLLKSKLNTEATCRAKCEATAACVAFDYTTTGKDACRIATTSQTKPRVGEAGPDNRQYCIKAAPKAKSTTTTTTTKAAAKAATTPPPLPKVIMNFKFAALDFKKLTPKLKTAVTAKVTSSVLTTLWTVDLKYTAAHIAVVLKAGSVIADVTITPLSGATAKSLVTKLATPANSMSLKLKVSNAMFALADGKGGDSDLAVALADGKKAADIKKVTGGHASVEKPKGSVTSNCPGAGLGFLSMVVAGLVISRF